MKRSLWIVLLACACFLGFSCQNSKKKNTPEAVAEQFAKAFYTGDFTHMYQYSTKKSEIVVKTVQNGMKDQSERLEAMKKSQVTIVETTVDAQTDSTCTCTCNVTIDGKPRTDKWELVKEDDLWKVTLVMP